MKIMRKLLSALTFLCTSVCLSAQVEAQLTIENQLVSGTDFFFDIYLTRTTTNPGSGFLYVSNADFVLTYNNTNFSSPVLSKHPTSGPGNCTFVPTDQSGSNTLITQTNYYDDTSPAAISNNELIINLNGPTPSDQGAFDSSVARIMENESFQLGRFKISGLTNPNSIAELAWKVTGVGLLTQVHTFEQNAPFNSSKAILVATDPDNSCTSGPPALIITPSTPLLAQYQAENTLNTSGTVTVENGASRTFKAGESISLEAEFEVELGGEFEALIESCGSVQGQNHSDF